MIEVLSLAVGTLSLLAATVIGVVQLRRTPKPPKTEVPYTPSVLIFEGVPTQKPKGLYRYYW